MGEKGREHVYIFDTTLRDGEQALQASLSKDAKVHVAKSLERLGVDYIEAGFPASSPGEFAAVQAIAREIKGARICGLARALPKDIEAAGKCLSVADQFRIHTFIATSPLHLRTKLRLSIDQVLEMTKSAVSLARSYTDDVEFSCEDAGRTPLETLYRVIETAIDAGAKTINVPDTVGYTIPSEFAAVIRGIRNNVPNIDQAIISVHCHDDLGLSVANSIAAISEGARQVEGTINGIGERAGNCALEEVIMILETRKDLFHLKTNINTKEIHRTSNIVSQRCHMEIQANKAIVGRNAFSHSSGIHQDGVLKEKSTYEIISPELIGLASNQLHMTSRSGRHAIKHRLSVLGYYEGEDYELEGLYEKFLALADRKGAVYDHDLEALIFLETDAEDFYSLEFLNAMAGSADIASATVRLRTKEGQRCEEAAIGSGPVDAAFKCIEKIAGKDIKLLEYKISAQGTGPDALGQVNLMILCGDKKYHGSSFSTDIVEASVKAYLAAINGLILAERIVSESRGGQADRQRIDMDHKNMAGAGQ